MTNNVLRDLFQTFTIIIETSSILREEAFLNFINRAMPYLKPDSIIIPGAVLREAENRCKSEILECIANLPYAKITDNFFERTDDAVLFEAIKLRRKKKILVVTQDPNLASDILNTSFRFNRIGVKKLNCDGNLVSFDISNLEKDFNNPIQCKNINVVLSKLGQ